MKKNTIALAKDAHDSEDFDVSIDGVEQGLRAREIRQIRNEIGLTQAEFATQFKVPIGTLRDWEQARVMPPEYALAYVRVIKADPALARKLIA